MFKPQNSRSGKIGGIGMVFALVFAVFVSVSCETGAIIEEDPVIIAAFPLESGGVIYGGWMPISIGFNTPMAEADAAYLANAVTVRDHNSIVIAGTVMWEDNAVYFSPAKKWKTSEKYTCAINGAFSTRDGRAAVIKTELTFYAVSDKDVETNPSPEIEEVILLRKTKDDDYEESPYDADDYWNNVIKGECGLKIHFNEDMDFSVPKQNLRMEPYRNYDVTVIDNRTLAVYFEAGIDPVKKITFTVLADTHSLVGEELKRDYEFIFTEWKDDLWIGVKLWLSAEYYEADGVIPMNQWDEPFQIGAIFENGAGETYFAYYFNYPVGVAAGAGMLSKIKLVSGDERIEKNPDLLAVELIPPEYDQTWTDIPLWTEGDLPYRYTLNIPGGIEGVNDDHGHYLKEDITIMLDVVDWDVIDPL
jgi:hypothetical protein